MNKTYT